MVSSFTDRADGLSSSTSMKGPCRVATTANISLSGLQGVDGVTLVDGDRVLVKNQTTASENGIYTAAPGAWSRARDFSLSRDVRKGTSVYVTDGVTNADAWWTCSATNPVTIGVSAITFTSLFTSQIATVEAAAAAAETARDQAQQIADTIGNSDTITEGSTNLYHTADRVRSVVLTGLSTATNAAITAADSVLSAAGKLQAQITGIVSAYVSKSSDTALTAGYTTTAVDDGTKSSGTYTPSPAGGNMRRIVNGGAFTLQAPSASGDFSMLVQVTNNASAGAITFSGFSKVSGDTLTTTNGDDYVIFITKINGFTLAQRALLQ